MEHKLQKACVAWFRMQYPNLLIFAIPNGSKLFGTKEQRIKQWNKLQNEGVTKGAADLFLAFAKGDKHGLFIEMKTTAKHSKQTDEQLAFEEKVVSFDYGYAMPRTFEEFKRVVKQYLNDGTY